MLEIAPPARLALLVGSNPLPNYVAYRVLRPKCVVLVHTQETVEQRDRLKEAIEKDAIGRGAGEGVTVKSEAIHDATNAREIRQICRAIEGVDHLHYSGGTKTMAAQARKVMALEDAKASYLDERGRRLRFDDGMDLELQDYGPVLDFDTVLNLHGVARKTSSMEKSARLPTPADAAAIWSYIEADPSRSQYLYAYFGEEDGKRKRLEDAKNDPFRACEEVGLSQKIIPGHDWTKKEYKAWRKFLGGGWLEDWTKAKIESLPEVKVTVEAGVPCTRKKSGATDEFEIDVALVPDHRLFVVSCTTAREQWLCKSKLFEVAMRSRQMGGDLARCALVCLQPASRNGNRPVDDLRSAVRSVWDAPIVPAVFGIEQLREWDNGTLGSLKAWLDDR
jgi:hypothetical protein